MVVVSVTHRDVAVNTDPVEWRCHCESAGEACIVVGVHNIELRG
jgi:hypothetical protein